MEDKWRSFLSRVFGVLPIELKQEAWSCCYRSRVYWTNLDLSNCPVPGRPVPLRVEDIVDAGWEPLHSINPTTNTQIWNCFCKAAPLGGYPKRNTIDQDSSNDNPILTRCYSERDYNSHNLLIKKNTTNDPEYEKQVQNIIKHFNHSTNKERHSLMAWIHNEGGHKFIRPPNADERERALGMPQGISTIGLSSDTNDKEKDLNEQLDVWSTDEYWRRIDRTGNSYSMDQMKWLLQTVTQTLSMQVPNNDEETTDISRDDVSDLTATTQIKIWEIGINCSVQNVKGKEPISINERRGGTKMCQHICRNEEEAQPKNEEAHPIDDNVETKAKEDETKATTYVWTSGHTPHYLQNILQNMKGREPISINERRGGTKLCQDICWTTSNCWLDQYDMTSKHSKNELHLMTLNCWFIKNGSNFQQIVVEILRIRPICVCLQEVTPTLFAMLAKSDVLRRNGYALFGRMDQDYITTGCSGINYGLAFVTREKLLNYRSVPFTQGENYAMSSPEFERAAYQAEIQHAKSTDKKCQVRLDVDTKCNSENDDASAPLPKNDDASAPLLPASSPLTTQGRYFDMAVAEDFIIVNVHAESLNAGIRRDKQFRAIVEHIRTVTTTNIPVYLCGDLNTTVGSAEEKVLLKYFIDTNQGKKVNTYLKTNRNYLKYYDRILKFKGTANQRKQGDKSNSGVIAKDWTTVDLNEIDQECIFDHKAVHVKVQWK